MIFLFRGDFGYFLTLPFITHVPSGWIKTIRICSLNSATRENAFLFCAITLWLSMPLGRPSTLHGPIGLLCQRGSLAGGREVALHAERKNSNRSLG
jgi:hypothetical protein